ncbi:hypothetical protein SAMN04487915_107180 [Arthrobacter sp. ov118]|nr:hypothetical protein SAMN04487915_107180 [Arthrobacter sp. ov118]
MDMSTVGPDATFAPLDMFLTDPQERTGSPYARLSVQRMSMSHWESAKNEHVPRGGLGMGKSPQRGRQK